MLNLLFLTILLQAGPTVSWTSEVEQTEDGPRLVLTGEPSPGIDHVSGTVDFMSCIGTQCNMPEDWEFDVYLHGEDGSAGTVAPASAATPPALQLPGALGTRSADAPASSATAVSAAEDSGAAEGPSAGSSLWGLILEAILWGFAMLLTPCVPISAIIGVTWLVGGSGVTADIFNWLATHWLPNIIFFLVFMVFAASFFGAFEITLPSKWTNSADRNSDRKGLGGVFFLALTLVLVSFSCTGPIVGTVLIKSTQGEFWAPMVTMLAFSIAFALPFTIFALFPSLLKKLPKSGGWLNSVKVVLGFVEVALGLKFLSVADQTYHWGLLDREVYLAIWIVVFTLLGFYLLGKLRFKYDSPVEHLTVKRLALAIAVFSFVVYMIPGMWGAPLKALSGYLPPMETQDFVIGQDGSGTAVTASPVTGSDDGMITIAHGLRAYDNIDDAVAAARRSGKRIFVDITGHGCVNCREMEARVWSDPEVLRMLREDFVILALYVDDKTKIPESEQIVTENGRALKDVGRLNSYIALTRFGVNSQPNYFVLDQNGEVMKGPRAYDLDIPAYIEFLSE